MPPITVRQAFELAYQLQQTCRGAFSVLSNIGLPQSVARTPHEFVRIGAYERSVTSGGIAGLATLARARRGKQHGQEYLPMPPKKGQIAHLHLECPS